MASAGFDLRCVETTKDTAQGTVEVVLETSEDEFIRNDVESAACISDATLSALPSTWLTSSGTSEEDVWKRVSKIDQIDPSFKQRYWDKAGERPYNYTEGTFSQMTELARECLTEEEAQQHLEDCITPDIPSEIEPIVISDDEDVGGDDEKDGILDTMVNTFCKHCALPLLKCICKSALKLGKRYIRDIIDGEKPKEEEPDLKLSRFEDCQFSEEAKQKNDGPCKKILDAFIRHEIVDEVSLLHKTDEADITSLMTKYANCWDKYKRQVFDIIRSKTANVTYFERFLGFNQSIEGQELLDEDDNIKALSAIFIELFRYMATANGYDNWKSLCWDIHRVLRGDKTKVNCIQFEGIPDSGKSAVIKLLSAFYNHHEVGYFKTTDRTGTFWLDDLPGKAIYVGEELCLNENTVEDYKLLCEGSPNCVSDVKFKSKSRVTRKPVLVSCNASPTSFVSSHTEAVRVRCIWLKLHKTISETTSIEELSPLISFNDKSNLCKVWCYMVNKAKSAYELTIHKSNIKVDDNYLTDLLEM